MPRANTTQFQNFDFTGGLNSDASLLAFPENATTDEQNFTLEPNGTRKRRKGLALESGGSYATKSIDSLDRQSAYLWRTPGGSSSSAMVVVKVKNELWFYDAGTTVSSGKNSYTYDLHSSKISSASEADVDNTPVQMANVSGRLIVAGQYIEPTAFIYDPEVDTFTVSVLPLRIRDFRGQNDGLEVTERPSTNSDEHNYNLLNQGWSAADISTFFTAKSYYPSNADIPYFGKIENPSTNVEEFNADQLEAQAFGNARAPNGSFIINVFDTGYVSGQGATSVEVTAVVYNSGSDTTSCATGSSHGFVVGQSISLEGERSYVDGEGNTVTIPLKYATTVATVPSSTQFTFSGGNSTWDFFTAIPGAVNNPNSIKTYSRPVAVASFAGRAWYAGVNATRYESSLFFSQIVEEDENLYKCYQRNDPTSEHLSDLLDSDGGRLVISDAGGIVRLVPYSSGLLVFAENGVWFVGPGEKGYFSPAAYSVAKIHDIGCVSGSSVVPTSDSVFYFGTDGIYAVFYDSESRTITARNISINKINTTYKNISDTSKSKAFGVYEGTTQQVVWVYPNAAGTSINRYINALIFNKRFGAFIPLKFVDSASYYITTGVALDTGESFNENIKLFVYDSANTRHSFYDLNQTTFEDFGISEEDAYLVTGITSGQSYYFPKTGSYVFTYFSKTETGFIDDGSGNIILENPSGCTLQSRWDWADNSASGKFGPSQQAYRFTRNYVPSGAGDTFSDGRPVVFTKNKIRGRGKALQLKFSADAGKDCWLLGWSMMLDTAVGK